MRGFFSDQDKKECCGTCDWHKHEDVDDGWVCVNPGSIYCTEWTDFNDYCPEWEERQR